MILVWDCPFNLISLHIPGSLCKLSKSKFRKLFLNLLRTDIFLYRPWSPEGLLFETTINVLVTCSSFRWFIFSLILAHRLRRLPNIIETMGKRIVIIVRTKHKIDHRTEHLRLNIKEA